METHPPELIEAIVEKLIPPACREHVLGDLCERFESRSQYVLDALRTVPFVIASQVRRTFDIAVFLSEASALYIGFAAASLAGGPGFLYDHSAFLPIALVMAVVLIVFTLRDAYADRNDRSEQRAAFDVWLALALAYASQGSMRLLHPQWLLPAWLMSLGVVINLPVLFLLRRFVQNNRTDPAAVAGAAAASLDELKRRAVWAHSRAWTLNWTWLALSVAVFYSTVNLLSLAFPFVFLVLGWFGGRPLPATFNTDEFTLSLAGFLVVCACWFVLRSVNRRAAQALQKEIDELDKQERGKS